MFMESNDIAPRQLVEAGTCLIGAGAAGIALAHDLGRSGRDVLLLEAGGRREEADSQARYAGSVTDARLHSPPDRYRQRRFGGSSTIWGGRRYGRWLGESAAVRVMLHANVRHVQLAAKGQSVDHLVVAAAPGREFRVRARHYVLAAGGLESARILLASRDVHPEGIGNHHDVLGRYSVDFHAEQEPNPASRLRLSQERDDLGLPRLEVDWRYTAGDVRNVAGSLRLLQDDFAATGAAHLDYDSGSVEFEMTRYGAYGGHHIGTLRMGRDPRTSMVDADCRVHGIGNLHVAAPPPFPLPARPIRRSPSWRWPCDWPTT
jgi:choline dehydrogenase-like flavoprotein